MPLAEARTLLEGRGGRRGWGVPRFFVLDPAADREGLRQLAWKLLGWTPIVGLEDAARPESLLLDVSGCAHLFGGEAALLKRFRQDSALRGLHFRMAIADTVGAAWAAARFGPDSVTLIPVGRQRQVLDELPPAALRLPPAVLANLAELGLGTIGRLAALPRSSLPSRFGPELALRLDQAFGDRPEPFAAERPPETVEASREFEFPLDDRWGLEQAIRQLLDRILERLQDGGRGTRQVAVRLSHEESDETRFDVRLVSASASRKRLETVFRTTWERIVIPEAVVGVRLQAVDPVVLPTRKGMLFEDDRGGPSEAWESLLERLGSRLGEHGVVRMERVADHAPERAFRRVPVTRPPSHAPAQPERPWPAGRFRPLILLSPPRPIRVLCLADGPPSHVRCPQSATGISQAWGPERIETGWWRDDPVRRDYYRVETDDGRRLWVYRELGSGRWFLHGTFE